MKRNRKGQFVKKAKANPRRNGFFGSNGKPMRGESAVEQYERVHWGNQARRLIKVGTPALRSMQPLVTMGRLRMLHLVDSRGQEYALRTSAKGGRPFLAFGQRDNRLYICGGNTNAEAKKRGFGRPGAIYTILRVDYDANKGGEDVYWYHAHEKPYPKLRILPSGHPAYFGGKYKVAPEGITG